MNRQQQKIHDSIALFGASGTIPLASDGEWSMHHLIDALVRKTGRCKIWLSSFSITEEAVRTFLNLKEEGLIDELHCLFDFTVKRHKVGLMFFASKVVDGISISKCHAKLILIQTPEVTLTVVGSANLNINDKKEVAVIHYSKEIFDFYHSTITSWMDSGIKVSPDEFI